MITHIYKDHLLTVTINPLPLLVSLVLAKNRAGAHTAEGMNQFSHL